jgi:hypothetical protein
MLATNSEVLSTLCEPFATPGMADEHTDFGARLIWAQILTLLHAGQVSLIQNAWDQKRSRV